MKINIINKQRIFKVSPHLLRQAVKSVIKNEDCACAEVSIYLITKQEIATLHAEYFNDPTPTDCISFPIDPETILGDVFVCPEVAIEYADKHGKDPTEEVILYVIHGLLHLIGYDDIDLGDRKKMRQAEERNLKRIKTDMKKR